MLGLGGAGTARDFRLIGDLIERAHMLAAEQHFLHWQIAFPGVWKNWTSAEPEGGFDAVIGNPPWDRMKMQEVEWFAARAPEVALQERAADRKALITEMKAAGHPLIAPYERASALAEKAMGLARRSGEYPLLSRGDINIYSLFVERAQSLIKQDGIAGILVPSGILSDAGSECFMKSIIQGKRFVLGIDFFNRRSNGTLFFPDVYYRFKFCVFIASGKTRKQEHGEAAFFVRDVGLIPHINLIEISESKLQKINPGRFVLPIIKDSRDVDVVTKIFQAENAHRMGDTSPRYSYMFHMAADSSKFFTITRLEAEGGYPLDASTWRWHEKSLVRLFEGKMIQAFDHRAASLSFYKSNIFRTGEGESTTDDEHADPAFLVTPRFYVELYDEWQSSCGWALAIKDITSTTNTRSTICSLIPKAGAGHTLAILFEDRDDPASHALCANLNSFALDFVARTKIQGNHLTLNILNDLPIIRSQAYSRSFGRRTAADIVKDHTLRLTYTAHDMAAFAGDMGYFNNDGSVKPPFIWNENERRHLRARIDALYFILYGLTDDEIRYILSTFPIVERKDREASGVFLTRELILWYKRALEGGDPDRMAPEAEVIRLAKTRGD
jgi:Eco57I restriction-modification methylase